jgi:hypothetical protein
LIRYDPRAPRIGFGIAAVIMSALTLSLMVVVPSALEQQSSTLAQRTEAPRTAAIHPGSDVLNVPCTVAAAINTPLFAGASTTATNQQCKQPS